MPGTVQMGPHAVPQGCQLYHFLSGNILDHYKCLGKQPFNYRMSAAHGKGRFPTAPGTTWQEAFPREAQSNQGLWL